jgi:hypothetical protein
MSITVQETDAARVLTVTGRIVGPVYVWDQSNTIHTMMLRTIDGKTVPLIVHGQALFKQCKKRRTLIVEGERNTRDACGQFAGTAIVVTTIRRSPES